jgi:hypothetical protein
LSDAVDQELLAEAIEHPSFSTPTTTEESWCGSMDGAVGRRVERGTKEERKPGQADRR